MNVSKETILPITQVRGWFDSNVGFQPNRSTLTRWYRTGSHGVRLETIKIGGRRYTSEEALHRFFTATTDAADGSPSIQSDSSAASDADEYLDAEGI